MKSAFLRYTIPAFAIALSSGPAYAQMGPGGVVATGTATNLGLWLTAERGTFTTGTTSATNGQNVAIWADQSGRSTNNATNSGTATTRPTFVPAGLNGFPVMNFASASGQTLNTALNVNPGTLPNISVIIVAAATTVNAGNAKLWGHDDGGYDRSVGIDSRAAGFNFGYFSGPTTGTGVGGLANLSTGNYFISTATYAGGTPGTFSGWHNGANIVSGASVSNTSGLTTTSIGSINGSAEYWNGPIAEFIVIEKVLNEAERIILHNHLSAKYGLSLAADDIYTMDNALSGSYDFEVAGIGASAAGPGVISARGTGIVQIGTASGMTAGEYFIFGHDNAALSMSGPDRPVGYTSRLRRSWRPSEVGDVGTMTVSFDLNSVSGRPANASDIVLVIDRDNDGLFSDETIASTGIVAASTFTGGIATFSGVNIGDQQAFTLAFNNTAALPLNLLSFTATAAAAGNLVRWETANTKGVAAIEVERSADGSEFNYLSRHALNENGRYEALDPTPTALAYYRLRILDADGSATYSNTEKVMRREGGASLQIGPNPARDIIRISGLPGTKAIIRVFDASGKQLLTQQTSETGLSISLARFPAGRYLVSVDADGVRGLRELVELVTR